MQKILVSICFGFSFLTCENVHEVGKLNNKVIGAVWVEWLVFTFKHYKNT
jgi:hypothetical protein